KADATEPFRDAVKRLKEETLDKLDGTVGGKETPEAVKRARSPQVDFLSEEKQRALEVLEKNYLEADGRLQAAKGGKLAPELQAKRAELQAQRMSAIRALMTPEEHSEYELRHSR